ncbi:hypothetical protein WBP06_19005 [Novosphingobium sp. BL-8H]|uniref:hypothetical protein n=1 Tax=Novosphingobium sp. BL-8H TaxID=3127640 RepID=UPI003756F9FD
MGLQDDWLKTTGLMCVLFLLAPVPADARSQKMQGAAGFAYLPDAVDWSLSDLSRPDQAKVVRFDGDSGDAGWTMDFRAVRSLEPMELAGDPDGSRFRGKSMGIGAWHKLGADDLVRLTATGGRVSRRAAHSLILPTKTRTGYAAADLAWEHGRDWILSAGYYHQGGWGGRSLATDVVHLDNGEPAAAKGAHAVWRFALAEDGSGPDGRSSWLGIDAHTGSRAAGVGQAMRHCSDVSLVLTDNF